MNNPEQSTEEMISYLKRDGKYKPVFFDHPDIADRLTQLEEENVELKEEVKNWQLISEKQGEGNLKDYFEVTKVLEENTTLKAEVEYLKRAIDELGFPVPAFVNNEALKNGGE